MAGAGVALSSMADRSPPSTESATLQNSMRAGGAFHAGGGGGGNGGDIRPFSAAALCPVMREEVLSSAAARSAETVDVCQSQSPQQGMMTIPPAAESWYVAPTFATRAHGLERPSGPVQQELYDLCARESVAAFLPDVALLTSANSTSTKKNTTITDCFAARSVTVLDGDISHLDPARIDSNDPVIRAFANNHTNTNGGSVGVEATSASGSRASDRRLKSTNKLLLARRSESNSPGHRSGSGCFDAVRLEPRKTAVRHLARVHRHQAVLIVRWNDGSGGPRDANSTDGSTKNDNRIESSGGSSSQQRRHRIAVGDEVTLRFHPAGGSNHATAGEDTTAAASNRSFNGGAAFAFASSPSVCPGGNDGGSFESATVKPSITWGGDASKTRAPGRNSSLATAAGAAPATTSGGGGVGPRGSPPPPPLSSVHLVGTVGEATASYQQRKAAVTASCDRSGGSANPRRTTLSLLSFRKKERAKREIVGAATGNSRNRCPSKSSADSSDDDDKEDPVKPAVSKQHGSPHHHYHHRQATAVPTSSASHSNVSRRHAVVAVLQGADPREQLVVLNVHASAVRTATPSPFPPPLSAADIATAVSAAEASNKARVVAPAATFAVAACTHHRRNRPPFVAMPKGRYAWTNALGAATTATAAASTDSVPFAIGFLLGNALSQRHVLRTPIAPLAFHIIKRAIRFDRANLAPTATPSPADVALLSDGAGGVIDAASVAELLADPVSFLKAMDLAPGQLPPELFSSPVHTTASTKASTRDLGGRVRLLGEVTRWAVFHLADEAILNMADPAAAAGGSGSGGDGIHSSHSATRMSSSINRGATDADADAVTAGVLVSAETQRRRERSRVFWREVVRGISRTSLVHSPLLAQSSSRTVQRLLCGDCSDDETRDFSFLKSFLFSVSDSASTPASPSSLSSAGARAYEDFLGKVILLCIENDFTVAEKRNVLAFITGRRLLSGSARRYGRSEFIFVDMELGLLPPPVGSSTGGKGRDGSGLPPRHPVGEAGTRLASATSDSDWPSMSSSKATLSTATTAAIQQQQQVYLTPARCDALLQRLPSTAPLAHAIHVPSYWDYLLVGSESRYVDGLVRASIATELALRKSRNNNGNAAALTAAEELVIRHSVVHSRRLSLARRRWRWASPSALFSARASSPPPRSQQ